MESLIPCLYRRGIFFAYCRSINYNMFSNPFETGGNNVLIDWFNTIAASPSGIYVVGGLSGTTVWSTKHRCREGLKSLGHQCVAVRGADKSLIDEAIRQAEAGAIVLLALKISHPDQAKARFDEYGIGSVFGLVRGILLQELVKEDGRTKVRASYSSMLSNPATMESKETHS
jgi:hypothetical protein